MKPRAGHPLLACLPRSARRSGARPVTAVPAPPGPRFSADAPPFVCAPRPFLFRLVREGPGCLYPARARAPWRRAPSRALFACAGLPPLPCPCLAPGALPSTRVVATLRQGTAGTVGTPCTPRMGDNTRRARVARESGKGTRAEPVPQHISSQNCNGWRHDVTDRGGAAARRALQHKAARAPYPKWLPRVGMPARLNKMYHHPKPQPNIANSGRILAKLIIYIF
jgi:hypothetical protein